MVCHWLCQCECMRRTASKDTGGASGTQERRGRRLRTDRGMTLIELLVVIVILVTLVAGVVPIFSPNNDARKIREAARQLSSMIAQAQSTAARNNRPAGIAFSGVDPATGVPRGVALEAYFIAQPPPFRGFDSDATVVMQPSPTPDWPNAVLLTFGRGVGEALGGNAVAGFRTSDVEESNWLPPRMIKVGDQVVVAGNRFRIMPTGINVGGVVNEVDQNMTVDIYGNDVFHEFLTPKQQVAVEWLDWAPNQDRLLPPGGHRYQVLRQAQATSDPPLQFPRGIGIDTTGSEGMGTFGPVQIMFYPSGQVEGVYSPEAIGKQTPDAIDILVGRAENARVMPFMADNNGAPLIPAEYIEDAQAWDEFAFSNAVTDDQLELRREEINWLNPDSWWIRIAARSGRVVSAENAYFDPRRDIDTSQTAFEQFEDQSDDDDYAKAYLRDMTRSGGG